MTYVYDLILNFNDIYYDFYEWSKDDNYYHIKKINLIKVESTVYNDFLDNKVKFNNDYFINIFNKCEYYDKKQIRTLPYALVVTDSYRAMAIKLDDNLMINGYSSLLLDEEEEILEISEKVPFVKIAYNIISKNIIDDLTRNEKRVLKFIAKNLKTAYSEKNYEKIHYFYYEYFNEENDDLDYMYQNLIKSLSNYTIKHRDLYNLMRLSCSS